MSNLNSLLKLASRTAALSFLTIIFIFSASLFSSNAHAAHITTFPKNAAAITYHLKAQKHYRLRQSTLTKNKIANKAINQALKKVADGTAYQWQHKRSNLAGNIKPTTTYLNTKGQLCRHIQFSLYAAGNIKKKSEALVCRNNNGQWIIKS